MHQRTSRRVTAAMCDAIIAGTRHRVCCRIPSWAAYVGQRWRPYDEAPWNLYNVWWRSGQWVANHASAD